MTPKPAHNQIPQHLKDAILLFSVPIGIIALLITFLYIPRLLASPSYDFIYCSGYSCENKFSVKPSGILYASDSTNSSGPKLFYYDVKRDASRPLNLDEAGRYRLDSFTKSPDGYFLKRSSSGGGGFLFWGSYSSGWSLSKGIVSKPITYGSNDYDNKFIGWVLQ